MNSCAHRLAIFADTSGEALFKRGYRGEGHEAPLRENLAAGSQGGFSPEDARAVVAMLAPLAAAAPPPGHWAQARRGTGELA